MDVKCEKCGTEYELDDALVSESGLTVKCTHCGHLFPVNPSEDPFADAVLASGEEAMPRQSGWRVRRRNGEELAFDDLGTLREWIIERKVAREDEISKTGESWKPIGSIIELSSLFEKDGEASPLLAMPEADVPPPPVNRSDLLDVRDVRLDGLDEKSDLIDPGALFDPLELDASPPPRLSPDRPLDGPGGTGLPFETAARRPPPLPQRRPSQQALGPPPVVQPPPRRPSSQRPRGENRLLAPPRRMSTPRLADRASINARLPHRNSVSRLPTHRDSVPSLSRSSIGERPAGPVRRAPGASGRRIAAPAGRPSTRRESALPPHRESTPRAGGQLGMAFEGEPPPNYSAQSPNSGRGFLLGVLATLALLGVAYFVYDNYIAIERPTTPPPVTESPPAQPQDGVAAMLDAADAALARESEAGLVEAEEQYQAGITKLGTPPSDAALWSRANLGRARVALRRAEYAQVDGAADQVKAHLTAADRALVVAQSMGSVPGLQLALADYHRIQGADDLARNYLEQARALPDAGPAVQLIEAALGLHAQKPAEAADRLGILPTEAKSLPHAAYLHAAALKGAGRLAEARGVLEAVLARNAEHDAARRLLDALPADGQPAGEPKAASEKPEQPEPEKPAAEDKPKPKPKPKPSKPTGSFDSLMDKGNALLERGKVKSARRQFKAAAEKRSSSPEPLASLGWCDLDEGKYRGAIRYFERALRKSSRYADAMYGLATAYDRAGMKPQAKQAYQAYLNVHPRGSKAGIVRRKLERL